MSCYLCQSNEYSKRTGTVRDNRDIDVLQCDECGLVYLSSTDHIKKEHYEESGMHDDGLNINNWLKETDKDDERRFQFIKEKITNKNVLDFGCGIGGFLEKAKTVAKTVVGVELERALQPSFKQRLLTVFSDLTSVRGSYDVITAFHVVEHLKDPTTTLKDLSALLSLGGEIIVEVPNSEDALLTLYNNKSFQNFTYWSQHLYLYNAQTIKELVRKSGLKVNWVKHIQRYSLANHLYWLAKGRPGGHEHFNFIDTVELNKQYESQLAALEITDTIIASIST
jgi:2-polyprenyl-3-methyl-5-hydroxy-6-metoxy-1,4-benzoquinol methylase